MTNKAQAFIQYLVENQNNENPTKWLVFDLYATKEEGLTPDDLTEYYEYVIEEGDLAQELDLHTEDELFIERMEGDRRFNFLFTCDTDFGTAFATTLDWALDEDELEIFEEITEVALRACGQPDVKEAMDAVKETGNPQAFANLVLSFVQEGDIHFIAATREAMTEYAWDIIG